MLDVYDFENDIWLCHSFQRQCFNFTAFVISLPSCQLNTYYVNSMVIVLRGCL